VEQSCHVGYGFFILLKKSNLSRDSLPGVSALAEFNEFVVG